MDTYRVLADGMMKKAANVNNTAAQILSSQQAITKLVNSLTKDDFNGYLPEMMKQKVVGLEEKYGLMHETLANYSKAIAAAANAYVATDQAIARWADELGVDEGTIRNGGTVSPGEEIKTGYQVPRDSIYYSKPNNPFDRGQCTWYAFARSQELTGKQVQWRVASGRDAGLWPEKASNLTAVAGAPSAGSLMTWAPGMGGAGSAGHVAVVEKVEPIYNANGEISDYNILYSQANWDTNWSSENPATDGLIAQRRLSDLSQNGISLWDIV